MSGTLDTFITSNKEPPEPIAVSQEIRDRGSSFVGAIYAASSLKEAESRISHVKHILHRSRKATHEMAAFRCMNLRPGATGLNGPGDFEVQEFNWDDGEKWGASKILNVMGAHAVIDAVVIVSRWYGGTMLGPVRFDHISTCATEVCIAFRRDEELKEIRLTLNSLDSILAALREELASKKSDGDGGSEKTLQSKKTPDYCKIDIATGQRLIRARENSIASVKKVLARLETASRNE